MLDPKLIARFRNGTPEQQHEARNKLWLECRPLVKKVAAAYAKFPPLSREDCADIATDAMFVMLLDPLKFDPERADGSGYVKRTMERAVLMRHRSLTRRGTLTEVSTDAPTGDGSIVLGDTLAAADLLGAVEARTLLEAMEPYLTERQVRVLRLVAKGWRVKEVATFERMTAARIAGVLRAIKRVAERRFATPLKNNRDKPRCRNRARTYPLVESFTADPETSQLLTKAARAAGKSRSAWIREVIREAAGQQGVAGA